MKCLPSHRPSDPNPQQAVCPLELFKPNPLWSDTDAILCLLELVRPNPLWSDSDALLCWKSNVGSATGCQKRFKRKIQKQNWSKVSGAWIPARPRDSIRCSQHIDGCAIFSEIYDDHHRSLSDNEKDCLSEVLQRFLSSFCAGTLSNTLQCYQWRLYKKKHEATKKLDLTYCITVNAVKISWQIKSTGQEVATVRSAEVSWQSWMFLAALAASLACTSFGQTVLTNDKTY